MPNLTIVNITLLSVYYGICVRLDLTEDTGWGVDTSTGGTLEIYQNSQWHYCLDFQHTNGELTKLYSWVKKLNGNTTYDLRIRFIRMGSVDGSFGVDEFTEILTTATTLNDDPTIGAGQVFIDSAGNNSNPGTSLAQAKVSLGLYDTVIGDAASIPGLVNQVRFAETIQHNIILNDQQVRSRRTSGVPDAWLLFCPADDSDNAFTTIRGWRWCNGPWTNEGSGIYSMLNFAVGTYPLGEYVMGVYDETEEALLPMCFKTLNANEAGAGSSEGAGFGLTANPTVPGWHFIRNASAVLQKLYVRTQSGLEPTNNQLRAAVNIGMVIAEADYFVIKNIKFQQCGRSQNTNPTVNRGIAGLHLVTCTNIIIRNCYFTDLSYLYLQFCSKVLIDDCFILVNGIWEQLCDIATHANYNPVQAGVCDGWVASKRQQQDVIGIVLEQCSQVEIRNSTCSGMANMVTSNNGAGSEAIYIHDNTGGKFLDECFEFDTAPVHGLLIANNQFLDCHNFISFTPNDYGPIWVISNLIQETLFTAYKFGATDYTTSEATIWYVNNTIYTTRNRVDSANGAFFTVSGNAGNQHYINCIWVICSPDWMLIDGNPTFPSGIITFDNCCFYNINGGSLWDWKTISYATPELLNIARGLIDIALTNITDHINPFLSGIAGPLNPALPLGTEFHGVTNLAKDNGEFVGTRLGVFAEFDYPEFVDTEVEAITHPTIYAALFNLFDVSI